MKRTSFDESRDQRIAADAYADRALMCCANGCPNRWSVDAGSGKACSSHAWADRSLWPRITDEQQRAETAQAMRQRAPVDTSQRRPATAAEREQLRRQVRLIGQGGSKDWAHALQRRDEAGEPLTPFQRDAWRTVLRPAHVVEEV